MKVKFIGPEDDVEVFGVTFERDKPTDISDLSAEFQATLAANPTFAEVKGRASKEEASEA